ncbi:MULTISPECIES: GTP cyclohydrolase FolE2 [Nocardia]|uniref:GTP cyclohydrolase FolE2 n=1 Tax=Nocardia TaxID=1817 RepID=UPI0018E58900|nr:MULTISPECIES: GTP cyclohydrolase FolE2 [Nocardia]
MNHVLSDVQAQPDTRGIALGEVGIDGLRYPLLVADGQGGKREVAATVTMSVSLGADIKGAHLSRFIEVLQEWRDQLGPDSALSMVDDLRGRMGSTNARVKIAFPYFLERQAPVTGIPSFMDYACELDISADDAKAVLLQQVCVPVTSVCPCSKAISDRGAHNQRGWVTIGVRARDPRGDLWFDDLITVAELSGSSPVYSLLKRPDERHVTMAAYDNPVFVEDMARNVVTVLRRDNRIAEYRVRVLNDESIHNHAAYAEFPWTTTDEIGGRPDAG